MKCKISRQFAAECRLIHKRILRQEVRHYYSHPSYPLLSVVVRDAELPEIIGQVRWCLFGEADGDMARDAIPGAPQAWAGGGIMQVTVTSDRFEHWSRKLRAAGIDDKVREHYERIIGPLPK